MLLLFLYLCNSMTPCINANRNHKLCSPLSGVFRIFSFPFLSLFVLFPLPGTNHQLTQQPHEPKKSRVCGRNCCLDQKLQRPNPNFAAVTPRFPFKNAKILTHESPSTQHSCTVAGRISLLFPLDDCVSVIQNCHTPSHRTFFSIESKLKIIKCHHQTKVGIDWTAPFLSRA